MGHLKRSSATKHLLRKTTAGAKHLVTSCAATPCPCDLGGGCCINPSATYSGTWSADARGISPCNNPDDLCDSQVTSGSFSGTTDTCGGALYAHPDPDADNCQEWTVDFSFSGDGSGGWGALIGLNIPCTTGTSANAFTLGGETGGLVTAACPSGSTQTFNVYLNNGADLVGSVSISFSNFAASGCTCTSALP